MLCMWEPTYLFCNRIWGWGSDKQKKANKFNIAEYIGKEYGEWTVQADLDIYKCSGCGSYCSEVNYY